MFGCYRSSRGATTLPQTKQLVAAAGWTARVTTAAVSRCRRRFNYVSMSSCQVVLRFDIPIATFTWMPNYLHNETGLLPTLDVECLTLSVVVPSSRTGTLREF